MKRIEVKLFWLIVKALIIGIIVMFVLACIIFMAVGLAAGYGR